MRNEWASPWRRRPVTVVLVAVCVALALNLFGIDRDALMFNWEAIQQGEVWRLITPILLHDPSNFLHLIFNMFWLFDLGTLIERRLGSFRYVVLVVLVALVSNYAQFLNAGANFLGMSGVVYGLFGYAWVRGRFEPTSGLYLRQQVIVLMMAWLVVCMLVDQLHVANTAHVTGLIMGAALGYLPTLMHQAGGGKNT
jgi:GlpG protein